METALACLLFFAAWTVGLLLFGLGPYRVGQVLRGKASPRAFPADQPHGPDAYRRLMRAHANCVENLPVFGAVVLSGMFSHLAFGPWAAARAQLFGTLAMVYVGARIGQTTAHLVSGRSIAINVRFSFFLVQLGVVIWMGVLVAAQLANR